MSLPEKVVEALFPVEGGPLFGFAIGASVTDVKKSLPSWFEKPVPDLTGDTFGWVGDEDGPRLCLSFSFSVGRLSRGNGTIDLESEDDLEPVFRELADHFDEAFGNGARTKKKQKNLGVWNLAGKPASCIRLEAAPYSMGPDGYLPRVEIYVELADGEKLEPLSSTPAWIDVKTLSKLVATKEWPAAKCAEVYDAFFAFDDAWSARSGAEDAEKSLTKIYAAVQKERPDLKETIRTFLAQCDWSQVQLENGDRDARRLLYATWGMSHYSMNLSVINGANNGLWIHVNMRVISELVSILTKKPDDRAEWGWKVIAALEYGDAKAFKEIADAMAAARASKLPEYSFRTTFDSTADIDRGTFELITSGLADEDRIRWSWKTDYRVDAVKAATAWLVSKQKIAAPAAKLPSSVKLYDEGKKNAQAWAEHLLAVKAWSPALFFEAIAACVDSLSFQEDAAEAALAAIGPDEKKQASNAATFWSAYRIGPWVVSRTGKKGKRGRLSSKRFDDEKKASKDFAKKAAAH